MQKSKLSLALIPVIFLITLLAINVLLVFNGEDDDTLAGPNQIILLLSAGVAAALGLYSGISWENIVNGISKSVGGTTNAILILLMIGALAGTWFISGIVPAMIYYGLQILSPSIFLPATAIICAMVSLATGSSWNTTATVGIALMGIAAALGISEAMAAGAILSGAYFGDKISPLSDTTNLAPAMAGTDLFTHIKYMLYTTIPSFIIALIIFVFLSIGIESTTGVDNIQPLLNELDNKFNISPWLFLVPVLLIVLIIKKVPSLPAILFGALGGGVLALIFQQDVLHEISGVENMAWTDYFKVIMNALTTDVSVQTDNEILSNLLGSSGMGGMLNTIWLILAAMVFGGVMEACGFLQAISGALLKLAKGTASLIATTVGTCLVVNVTASDQYLAIVVPGKMYEEAYRKRGLAPENLSRTLEDSGTVTSVLVPWNTCGAYQSDQLGVDTMAYLPFAFFNIISPFMTLIFAIFNIKIRQLKDKIIA